MISDRLRRRMAIAVAAATVALVWSGGCGDGIGPTTQSADSVIVSNPVPIVVAAGFSASVRGATVNAADEDLVYVSLAPGTIPDGLLATVRKLGATNTVEASIVAGGLDPVPVIASAGDDIEIVVTRAESLPPVSVSIAVPARRRPVVVRTDPPPRKRDVPLNTTIVIVFNEPVASTSLASGVRLFRDNTLVPGTVELLEGTATAAVFRPSAILDPNSDYRLVVSQGVTDVTGDALAATVTVEFTTGTTIVGQAYSVAVVPDTTALQVGWQVQLTAIARDSGGSVVTGRPVTWSSDNDAVASVSTTGVVTGLGQGEAHIQAAVDGQSGVAVVFSGALAPVASVEIRPESAAIVINGLVQLSALLRDAAGNVLPFRPITWQSAAPAVATVSGGSDGEAVVTGVSIGRTTITAISDGKSDTAAIAVGTVGPFTQISNGGCAVAVDSTAWCWGSNGAGDLGNGTLVSSPAPTAVTGGLRFSRISGTCGLTVDSAAYCWGVNWSGALGIGTTTGPEECPNFGACSTSPVAVTGTFRFSAIDRGVLDPFTCALARGGDAYCWGDNGFGQLGAGVRTGPEFCPGSCSTVPAKVVGGLTFTAVTAGRGQVCALTASGAAYCWGDNADGQLGDGTTSTRMSPTAVVGGHTFVALAAGYDHTCGVASDSIAYCWGAGGALGGSPTSWIPVAVAGNLKFATISGGVHYSCALTTAGLAYCWGSNWIGQLGDGTTIDRTAPTPVAGGHVFKAVDVGYTSSCGITTAGVAYCWGDGNTVPVKVPGQP